MPNLDAVPQHRTTKRSDQWPLGASYPGRSRKVADTSLLFTCAAGANGDRYGALLEFDLNGEPRGLFSDDGRIFDLPGLGVNQDEGLLFLNSGAARVLAPGGVQIPSQMHRS